MKTTRALKNCALNRIFHLLCLSAAISLAPQAMAVEVASVDPNIVTMNFGETVSTPSATDPGNYTIYTKGVASVFATNAVLQNNGQSVVLRLNGPVSEFFAVSVNNVMNTFGSNITANATGYASDFLSTIIGVPGDPSPIGDSVTFNRDSFSLTVAGSDIGSTNGVPAGNSNDHCRFVYQPFIGNFDCVARVNNIRPTDPGSKAGLMVREFLTPGSKMVGTFYTALSLGTGLNEIQMAFRGNSNGPVSAITAPISTTRLDWLRVTRTNNVFTTYYGTNGLDWTQSSTLSLALNSQLYVGITATAHTNGDTTTAGFTSFGIDGTRPGDGVLPTMSAYVYNATNLIVKWQRTPRDFTVQVSTNFAYKGNGNQVESNSTVWSFVMLPVFDTALTGTNAAVPTSGRYMTLPMDMFPAGSPMFVRLAQVDRVIPDPPGVTPGIIFSQASGSLKGAPAGLSAICGASVIASTAVAQTNVPIICPATPAGKYTYQFTTAPSGSSYGTILTVRNFPIIGVSNCDTMFSAGSGKSRVTLTPTTPNTGYTFVTAATATPTVGCPIRVQVNIITNF